MRFLIFHSKTIFDLKLFSYCYDKSDYPGSIVYLSCSVLFVIIVHLLVFIEKYIPGSIEYFVLFCPKFFFWHCCDEFNYPGSIVYLSCLPQKCTIRLCILIKLSIIAYVMKIRGLSKAGLKFLHLLVNLH